MNKALLAAATAFSMISVPALADHHEEDMPPMTAEQQMMYDDLSATDQAVFDTYPTEQKVTYFAWPVELRDYYWTLDTDQQDAWWYLNDEQRMTIYNIPAEQQMAAWNSVTSQVARMESGQTAGNQQATANRNMNSSGMNSNANIRFVRNAVVQSAPAPHQGEYPVCDSDADDNCMNPWEAGRRGPGVERPLGYWPGDRS